MTSRESIRQELERIRQEHRGLLLPEDVVQEAESEDSVLHNQFEWDDSEAGKRYRIWQARQLIRVIVEILPEDPTQQEVHTYVSLTKDRKHGNGYRAIADVLTNEQLRQQLLKDAKFDMIVFKAKYKQLKELDKVFAAMDEIDSAVVK